MPPMFLLEKKNFVGVFGFLVGEMEKGLIDTVCSTARVFLFTSRNHN
jgi:hypothetical protein